MLAGHAWSADGVFFADAGCSPGAQAHRQPVAHGRATGQDDAGKQGKSGGTVDHDPLFHVAPLQYGKTALHYACMNGHPAIAQILLMYGADPFHRDNEFSTPLDDATDHGHHHIVAQIQERIPEIQLPAEPDPPQLKHASSDTLEVEWKVPALDSAVSDGPRQISMYRLQLAKLEGTFVPDADSREWRTVSKRVSSRHCRIRGLRPNQSFVTRVSAGNQFGWGPWSDASEIMRTHESAPTKPSPPSSAESDEESSSWEEPKRAGDASHRKRSASPLRPGGSFHGFPSGALDATGFVMAAAGDESSRGMMFSKPEFLAADQQPPLARARPASAGLSPREMMPPTPGTLAGTVEKTGGILFPTAGGGTRPRRPKTGSVEPSGAEENGRPLSARAATQSRVGPSASPVNVPLEATGTVDDVDDAPPFLDGTDSDLPSRQGAMFWGRAHPTAMDPTKARAPSGAEFIREQARAEVGMDAGQPPARTKPPVDSSKAMAALKEELSVVKTAKQVSDRRANASDRKARQLQNQVDQLRAKLGTHRGEAKLLEGLKLSDLEALEAELEQGLRAVRAERNSRIRHADETKLCLVCSSRPRNALLLPCKHLCLCQECSRAMFDVAEREARTIAARASASGSSMHPDAGKALCPVCHQVCSEFMAVSF
jgi:hypothetical protein